MTQTLLLDLTHTSHTTARTGIQKVVRSLYAALGERAATACHDHTVNAWRPLRAVEAATLASSAPGSKRGAKWPVSARLGGQLLKLVRGKPREAAIKLPKSSLAGAFVEPELFSPATGRALPRLFAAMQGPRVAIFHDNIALKLPELSPRGTVARYPAYMDELMGFDAIAATSLTSRDMFADYCRWLGLASPPPVEVIGLGVDPAPTVPPPPPVTDSPVVLSVGTIEGRKNHLALLDAADQLWAEGRKFTLRLVGMVQPETGRTAQERIRALLASGRPLRHDGAVTDATIEDAYASCSFTVYPSLMEGFGLPVIESLARGRPCICRATSAMGESARGGGCATVETPTAANLAAAIRLLLDSPRELSRLAEAARARRFRTWKTYADELASWVKTVRRR